MTVNEGLRAVAGLFIAFLHVRRRAAADAGISAIRPQIISRSS